MKGTIESIFLAGAKREPMQSLARVAIIATGVAGDRYAIGAGSFSKAIEEGDAGRHVTLIESESIEAAAAEFGIDWREGRHRRNLVTRGIALNALVNRYLRIGDVVLRGERHCPPCGHLQKLTGLDAMNSLRSRGGLRARVAAIGEIRIGDEVEVLERYR